MTGCEGREGPVRGVADYRTVTSIDRLERSIEDAKWSLEQLESGKTEETLRGTR